MASNNKSNSNTGSGEKAPESTNSKIIKDGWGSERNFMASHGLRPDGNGHQDRQAILDGYHKVDIASGKKGESGSKKK